MEIFQRENFFGQSIFSSAQTSYLYLYILYNFLFKFLKLVP